MALKRESRQISAGRNLQPPDRMIDVAVAYAETHAQEIRRHREAVITIDGGVMSHPAHVFSFFNMHARAFLWELVAAFDLTLQWANVRFSLGLQDRDVTWTKVAQLPRVDPSWAAAFSEMDSTRSSEWFSSLTLYRNYAHRSFLSGQGLHRAGVPPMLFWPNAVDNDGPLEDVSDMFDRYVIEFKSFLQRLRPLMA